MKHTYNLVEGGNNIGWVLKNRPVDNGLFTEIPPLRSIYGFEGGQAQYMIKGFFSQTLTELKYGYGYWLDLTAPFIWTVTDDDAPPPPPVETGTLYGKVTADGKALSGVRVEVSNSPATTTSDKNGDYHLEKIPANQTFSARFSKNGYATKEIK